MCVRASTCADCADPLSADCAEALVGRLDNVDSLLASAAASATQGHCGTMSRPTSFERQTKWLWVKNRYPKWNLSKWKHGCGPIPSGLILTHTQMRVLDARGAPRGSRADVGSGFAHYI